MLFHIRNTWNNYLNTYFLASGSEILTRYIAGGTFIKHSSYFDTRHLWSTLGNITKGNRCAYIYMYRIYIIYICSHELVTV